MKNPEHIKAFGRHVRKLRSEKGWSQNELAMRADIPKITIQRIELAKTSTTIDMAVSIAHAMEIRLHELLSFALEE